MPIITVDDGMKVVEFGTGDICIQDTRPEDGEYFNGLCFFQMETPRTIDSTTDEFNGMKLSDVDAAVHFVFNKKESIQALINSLTALHDNMPEDGASAPEPTEQHNEVEAV